MAGGGSREDPNDKRARERERRISLFERRRSAERNAATLTDDLEEVYGTGNLGGDRPADPGKPKPPPPPPRPGGNPGNPGDNPDNPGGGLGPKTPPRPRARPPRPPRPDNPGGLFGGLFGGRNRRGPRPASGSPGSRGGLFSSRNRQYQGPRGRGAGRSDW